MRIRASLVTAACFAVAAAPLTFANPATAATSWGPVVTVADQTFENLSTVTTDNGMVVAVWTGRSFKNLYISERSRSAQQWSTPTKIVTSAAGVSLSKDGKGAWLLWQGFTRVSALRIPLGGERPVRAQRCGEPLVTRTAAPGGRDADGSDPADRTGCVTVVAG